MDDFPLNSYLFVRQEPRFQIKALRPTSLPFLIPRTWASCVCRFHADSQSWSSLMVVTESVCCPRPCSLLNRAHSMQIPCEGKAFSWVWVYLFQHIMLLTTSWKLTTTKHFFQYFEFILILYHKKLRNRPIIPRIRFIRNIKTFSNECFCYILVSQLHTWPSWFLMLGLGLWTLISCLLSCSYHASRGC